MGVNFQRQHVEMRTNAETQLGCGTQDNENEEHKQIG